MDKKAIIIILAIVVVGVGFGTFLYFTSPSVADGNKLAEPSKPVTLPEGVLYFYGQECPHCIKVGEFLEENNMDQKVSFTKFEVWHNNENRDLMLQAAKNCNLLQKDVGVPFLYDGQNCLIGEIEVMDFFKEKAQIQ